MEEAHRLTCVSGQQPVPTADWKARREVAAGVLPTGGESLARWLFLVLSSSGSVTPMELP